jgi:hypothetical protein
MFSNAVSIDPPEAEALLRLGIKAYSSFGKLCPVSLSKNNCVLKRTVGSKPVIYRDNIYFLKGDQEREVSVIFYILPTVY